MRSKKKKEMYQKKNFNELPPRVIIHEILTRIVVNPNKSPQSVNEYIPAISKYVFFGYFKKDRMRNIWFIFPSVLIKRSFSYYISSSKLYCLILSEVNGELITRIIRQRANFLNLKYLRIKEILNENEELWEKEKYSISENLFSTGSFPKLTRLNTRFFQPKKYLLFDPKQWPRNNEFWNKLEHLEMKQFFRRTSLFEERIKKIFVENTMTNLRVLFLQNFHFPEEIKSEKIRVPRIEKLVLEDCQNLNIKSGRFLKIFESSLNDQYTIKSVFSSSPDLRELYIALPQNEKEFFKWFFANPENPLRNLRKLEIQFGYGLTYEKTPLDEWKNKFLEDKNQSMKNSSRVLSTSNNNNNNGRVMSLDLSKLEYFKLLCSKKMKYKLLSYGQEFPFLKHIYISDWDFEVGAKQERYKFAEILETIRYENLSIKYKDLDEKETPMEISAVDFMFQLNNYKNLRVMYVENCPGFTGKNYPNMPRLESITFFELPLLRDEFFFQQDLGKLEILVLDQTNMLSMKGYGCQKFRSLRNLKLQELTVLSDAFFQENDFPNIQEIQAIGCNSLNGKDWNPMTSLRKIEIIRGEGFNVHDFKEGIHPDLEKLFVTRMGFKIGSDDTVIREGYDDFPFVEIHF